MKDLIENYEMICNKIVEEFAKKQGYSDWYWIGDNIGGCVDFNESYTFSFHDIVMDIKTKQRKGLIQKWQDDGIEFNENRTEPKWISYKSYIMGLRYNMI